MPQIQVVFYQEEDDTVPILEWLDTLPPKVQDKCFVRIERLGLLGHELRRPEADYLRDKIYELRIGFQGTNYRILYFFYEDVAAVLAHGIMKERVVPPEDINKAIERKIRFEKNPEARTYSEEEA